MDTLGILRQFTLFSLLILPISMFGVSITINNQIDDMVTISQFCQGQQTPTNTQIYPGSHASLTINNAVCGIGDILVSDLDTNAIVKMKSKDASRLSLIYPSELIDGSVYAIVSGNDGLASTPDNKVTLKLVSAPKIPVVPTPKPSATSTVVSLVNALNEDLKKVGSTQLLNASGIPRPGGVSPFDNDLYVAVNTLAIVWKKSTVAGASQLVQDALALLKVLDGISGAKPSLGYYFNQFVKNLYAAKDPIAATIDNLFQSSNGAITKDNQDSIFSAAQKVLSSSLNFKNSAMQDLFVSAQTLSDALTAQGVKKVPLCIGCTLPSSKGELDAVCPAVCAAQGAQYCKNSLCGKFMCGCYINGCPTVQPAVQPESKGCFGDGNLKNQADQDAKCPAICAQSNKGSDFPYQYCQATSCAANGTCGCFTQAKGCPTSFAQAYIKNENDDVNKVCPGICSKNGHQYCSNYGSFFGDYLCGCYDSGCPPDFKEYRKVSLGFSGTASGLQEIFTQQWMTTPLPESKGCFGNNNTAVSDCPSVCLHQNLQYCPGSSCDEFGQCGCYALGKGCPAPQAAKAGEFGGCIPLPDGSTCDQLCSKNNLHHCSALDNAYACGTAMDNNTHKQMAQCPCFAYGCPPAGSSPDLGVLAPDKMVEQFANDLAQFKGLPYDPTTCGTDVYSYVKDLLQEAIRPSYKGPGGLQLTYTPEIRAQFFDLFALKLKKIFKLNAYSPLPTKPASPSEVDEINFYFQNAQKNCDTIKITYPAGLAASKQVEYAQKMKAQCKADARPWLDIVQFVTNDVLTITKVGQTDSWVQANWHVNNADRKNRLIAALVYKIKEINNALYKPTYTLINSTKNKLNVIFGQPTCARKDTISIEAGSTNFFQSLGCPVTSLQVTDSKGNVQAAIQYALPMEKNAVWIIQKNPAWEAWDKLTSAQQATKTKKDPAGVKKLYSTNVYDLLDYTTKPVQQTK